MTAPVQYLDRDEGRLAYVHHDGKGPGLVWLGGFNATMEGDKARALDAWARKQGRAFTRFDYYAHGQSSGDWERATVGRWRADALAVLDDLTDGKQILVGSSLGSWIALLAAIARPERVAALVLVAPAPDFTETLMWENFPHHVREALDREGRWSAPSEYGEPVTITRTLIEEGRNWLVLDAPIELDMPVRILQGWRDRDVPWSHAVRLMESLVSRDVTLELIKSGDHRLSTQDDLERLFAAIEDVNNVVRNHS